MVPWENQLCFYSKQQTGPFKCNPIKVKIGNLNHFQTKVGTDQPIKHILRPKWHPNPYIAYHFFFLPGPNRVWPKVVHYIYGIGYHFGCSPCNTCHCADAWLPPRYHFRGSARKTVFGHCLKKTSMKMTVNISNICEMDVCSGEMCCR